MTSAKVREPWYLKGIFSETTVRVLTYQISSFQYNSNEFQTGVILPHSSPQNEPLKSPPRLGLNPTSFQRAIVKDLNQTHSKIRTSECFVVQKLSHVFVSSQYSICLSCQCFQLVFSANLFPRVRKICFLGFVCQSCKFKCSLLRQKNTEVI